MTYSTFSSAKIGEIFSFSTPFGTYDFVKYSEVGFLVCFAAKCGDTFMYSRFTTELPTIEAADLYDTQIKLSC